MGDREEERKKIEEESMKKLGSYISPRLIGVPGDSLDGSLNRGFQNLSSLIGTGKGEDSATPKEPFAKPRGPNRALNSHRRTRSDSNFSLGIISEKIPNNDSTLKLDFEDLMNEFTNLSKKQNHSEKEIKEFLSLRNKLLESSSQFEKIDEEIKKKYYFSLVEIITTFRAIVFNNKIEILQQINCVFDPLKTTFGSDKYAILCKSFLILDALEKQCFQDTVFLRCQEVGELEIDEIIFILLEFFSNLLGQKIEENKKKNEDYRSQIENIQLIESLTAKENECFRDEIVKLREIVDSANWGNDSITEELKNEILKSEKKDLIIEELEGEKQRLLNEVEKNAKEIEKKSEEIKNLQRAVNSRKSTNFFRNKEAEEGSEGFTTDEEGSYVVNTEREKRRELQLEKKLEEFFEKIAAKISSDITQKIEGEFVPFKFEFKRDFDLLISSFKKIILENNGQPGELDNLIFVAQELNEKISRYSKLETELKNKSSQERKEWLKRTQEESKRQEKFNNYLLIFNVFLFFIGIFYVLSIFLKNKKNKRRSK